MSKKRKTLKEKQKAAERRLAWTQNSGLVKREFETQQAQPSLTPALAKQPEKSDQSGDFGFLARDLAKTLLITSLILASELVLYFKWR